MSTLSSTDKDHRCCHPIHGDSPSIRNKNKRSKPSGRPRSFVTWNCNGLTSRCTYNEDLLQQLVQQTNADVYCFQEVRLKAHRSCSSRSRSSNSSSSSNWDRRQPLSSEYEGAVQRVLENSTFWEYEPYWSLADTKYAGTLTLIRKSLGQPLSKAFSTRSALNVLLNEFSLKPQDCGISINDDNSNNMKSPSIQQKQPSIKSFFAAKKPSSPSSKLVLKTQHHPEGRFQFFRLDAELDLIQVYVPNNGDRAETWERRRAWDESLREFLDARRTIYQRAGLVREPMLIVTGDFNVARTYRDGTHWEQRPDGSVYEYWTDEAKCLVKRNNSSSSDNNNKHPDNVGIASFTPAERRRFNQLLELQDLCDVWRELHPNGVVDQALTSSSSSIRESNMWDQPNWTWRGHLSKDEDRRSKYEGKGQRLDYFLLSPSSCVNQEVKSCDILGHGRLREGLFCGSDHCAVLLKLKDTTTSNPTECEA